MALMVMILRKMINNKALELSLLLGLIIIVALMSSMPIYRNGVLNRMITRDLELMQKNTGEYPGMIRLSGYIYNDQAKGKEMQKAIRQIDGFMQGEKKDFHVPVLQYIQRRQSASYDFKPANPEELDPNVSRFGGIGGMTGLERRVKLVDGRMPEDHPVNGVYEVLVTRQGLNNLHIVLGSMLIMESDEGQPLLKVKPVGVIKNKTSDAADNLYWSANPPDEFNSTFLMNDALYDKVITYGGKSLANRYFYYDYVLNYTKINLSNRSTVLSTYKALDRYTRNHLQTYAGNQFPARETLQSYGKKSAQLRSLLLVLNVPVIIMIGFYLYMISNIMVERQESEIAVLQSRGAGRIQVFCVFLVEGLILGCIALGMGPFAGLWFTRLLGASNGFLQFVDRAALHVQLHREAYAYAGISVLFSLIMTLLPALRAAKVSIVERKRKAARNRWMSVVDKLFLDVILMAIALYELYKFHQRIRVMAGLGLESGSLSADPALFLMPAMFILGFGLLILRIYPWLMRILFRAGRRWWSPPLYASVLQVGRSAPKYRLLMLFLILTLAVGMFSASAARTLNKNLEDHIRYRNGADIVLSQQWENNAPPPGMGAAAQPGGPISLLSSGASGGHVTYTEPPFGNITRLPGVAHAAKVFVKDQAQISHGNRYEKAKLIGIDTDQFGRTAWYRRGMLAHSFNDYLNLLASNPYAVLVSRSVEKQLGVKPGDQIYVGWNGAGTEPFVVYGAINYFPTFNPNPAGSASDGSEKDAKPMLVVGHLKTIQNVLDLEPYQDWIKVKAGASQSRLIAAMQKENLKLTAFTDTKRQIVALKNDPFILSLNGVLTLGFLIAVLISFLGFLLYWLLTLRSRSLQLGIIRAMGFSFRQLVSMLAVEQLLTSGAGIVIGLLTGGLAAKLFVPLFQIAFNPGTEVPPFQVVFQASDAYRLDSIVLAMMGAALLLLIAMLSRLQIHQAVKLGED